MSAVMEEDIKRWTARRKATLDLLEIIQGKMTVAEASRSFDLTPSEIEEWVDEGVVTRASTVDVLVPAEAEFVLEGTVYADRRHAEGPFVDLNETYDIVRQEPVFQVKAITQPRDAIWQGLLPCGLEHKLLMGMPREPTIFQQVSQVVECLDVHIDPGGCSWLHAVVKIRKRAEDDGKKAIQAAFAGHRSCMHVFVVDEDIDIYDSQQVEWAMATRFQGDAGLVLLEERAGFQPGPVC